MTVFDAGQPEPESSEKSDNVYFEVSMCYPTTSTFSTAAGCAILENS